MNRRPGLTSIALTVVGAMLLGWWTVLREYGDQPTWALTLFALALLCWVARITMARMGWWRTGTVLATGAIALGSMAGSATQGNSLVPAAVCLLVLVGDPDLPLRFGIAAALASLGLIGIGALIRPLPAAALATMLGVAVIAVLAGLSRRQGRQAQQREALLAEREVAIREEAIRVALARDLHDVLAHTLPDIVVVGTAADGAEAVRLAVLERPDVVLMDLRMPVLDGVAATARLRADVPDAAVLVLTTYADDESILAALRAGATGYLTKDAGRAELAAAVRSVARGQATFAAEVGATVIAAATTSATAEPVAPADLLATRFPELTRREAEVLALIVEGLGNAEIAARLFVGVTTVKTHINAIFAKLGVHTRAEAIARATQG
ncbi:MAG: response regulator transcription factor [Micropruina sp.]